MLSIKVPNPSCGALPRRTVPVTAFCESPFVRCGSSVAVAPRGLAVGFRSLDRRVLLRRSVLAFSAAHEESKGSDIEVEKENEEKNLKTDEVEEAWRQTLAGFMEQAAKMQSVSQEAYEIYSKKAMVILKETSEQLRIQADNTSKELSLIAQEIGEEGKEYLSTAVESEPVKEIVETFSSSTEDFSDVSKLRDFQLGIPYGLLLTVGGFISFMLTGSTAAIRFGIILGGALLALSMSSKKACKRGESFSLAVKGQAAIATIIFLREIFLISQRLTLPTLITTLVSGAMVAFYLYRILIDSRRRRQFGGEPGTGN